MEKKKDKRKYVKTKNILTRPTDQCDLCINKKRKQIIKTEYFDYHLCSSCEKKYGTTIKGWNQ